MYIGRLSNIIFSVRRVTSMAKNKMFITWDAKCFNIPFDYFLYIFFFMYGYLFNNIIILLKIMEIVESLYTFIVAMAYDIAFKKIYVKV